MDQQEILSSLIDKIITGDNTGAQDNFSAIMSSRLNDALNDKKVELAQAVYSSQQPENGVEQEEQEDN